jgi:ParB family transcriptional regulator, chromosome partitioning protein
MKITGYEFIDINQLEIGLSQARTRDISKNIDDLARSIEKVGLLEPIVVAKIEDGAYEVITGQRRFLACKNLGHETIRAGVLDGRPEGDLAKAISLTENMVREDMPLKDYIDACTELYKRYGSIKLVCEELGLPHSKVSKYVKFEQLIAPIKERVESGKMTMDSALRAQAAATSSEGDIDEDLAITLADEMKGMSGAQQKKLTKVAHEMEGAETEDIIEAGRKQAKVKEIVVTLDESIYEALDDFAAEEQNNKAEAAANLIEDGLAGKGYGGTE